jgi:hypothetical protein
LLGSRSLQRITRGWRLHLGVFTVFMASIETSRLIEARRHLSSFRLNPLLHLGAMRGCAFLSLWAERRAGTGQAQQVWKNTGLPGF